jgi:hypothetical protein
VADKKTPAEKRYQAEYQARPEQVENRMARNRARYAMEKKGLVHKGDGKDVDHKKMLKDGGTNAPSNLRVQSASKNRARNR